MVEETREKRESWPLREGHVSVFKSWELVADNPSWQDRVATLAEGGWVGSSAEDRCREELKELMHRLQDLDPHLAFRMEDASDAFARNALDFGAVLGYALAKTYPAGLEEMDNWVEAALDFAELRGFPDFIQEQDGEEHGDDPPMQQAI